jgi:hypothetical protein
LIAIEDFESPGIEIWGYYVMPFFEQCHLELSPMGILTVGI